MEETKSRMKEHIFIWIISITLGIACIILAIYFAKYNQSTPEYIVGWIILFLWLPSILPAGYYYFRAEANSFYQRQPKFIFHERLNLFGFIILLAPIFVPNYLWLFWHDMKRYKRRSF